MRMLRNLKRVPFFAVLFTVLLLTALLYLFFSYSSWLTASCIAPVGADIKFHVATVNSFVEQIKAWSFFYPIEYLQDVSGFYWYTRGFIPLVVPSLFSLFLPMSVRLSLPN